MTVAEIAEAAGVQEREIGVALAVVHQRGFATAVGRLVDGDDAGQVQRDQVAVMDQAFDLVEHGVGGFPP